MARRSAETLKIRRILEDKESDDVCLQNIIEAFVDCAGVGSELEYSNSPHVMRRYRHKITLAEKLIKEHKQRLTDILNGMYLVIDKVPDDKSVAALKEYNRKRIAVSNEKKKLSAIKLLQEQGFKITK